MGAGTIGKQVASERSEQATCRGYYSCCTVLLYCLLLHYKSVMYGFLSPWVGLFSGERVTPTPVFEQPLKFIADGHLFKSLLYDMHV